MKVLSALYLGGSRSEGDDWVQCSSILLSAWHMKVFHGMSGLRQSGRLAHEGLPRHMRGRLELVVDEELRRHPNKPKEVDRVRERREDPRVVRRVRVHEESVEGPCPRKGSSTGGVRGERAAQQALAEADAVMARGSMQPGVDEALVPVGAPGAPGGDGPSKTKKAKKADAGDGDDEFDEIEIDVMVEDW